jgi:hypothetical protein
MSGATSGAMSGAMDDGGSSGAGGSGMGDGGGGDTGGGAPDPATVKAMCKAAGTPTFSAADFCALFEATCSAYIIPTATLTNSQATCETAYAALGAMPRMCRSQHVCNAAVAGPLATHCPHAQGWMTATKKAGGPCM